MAVSIPLILTVLVVCSLRVGSQVISLNSSSFDELVTQDSGDWLIEFYAAWCQPCQKFAPTYESIADSLSGRVKFAKVDVNLAFNRKLGTRFDIEAFPSFKLIHKGYTFTYQGPITRDDLLSFALGGFKLYQAVPTPAPTGLFGDILRVYKISYANAWEDLKTGNFFTLNIFVSVTPFLLLLIIAIGNSLVHRLTCLLLFRVFASTTKMGSTSEEDKRWKRRDFR